MKAALFVAALLTAAPLAPPPAPAELPPYSERLPDTYEGLWPTGARTPMYLAADLAHAVRRVPRREYEATIAPQAALAVRLMRRALADPRAAARLAPRAAAPALAALAPAAVPPGRWTVDFALRAGDLEREWTPVALAPPACGADLQRVDTTRAVRLLAPHLRALQEAWEPGAAFRWPRTVGFVDARGAPDARRIRGMFEDLGEEPWNHPEVRLWRFADAAGNVLLDGRARVPGAAALAAVRGRLATRPGDVLATEAVPDTRFGADTVVLRQAVAEDGRGGARAFGPPRTFTAAGREVPTELAPGGYPEFLARYTVSKALLDWACRVAGRLDATRWMRLVAELDGEAEAAPALAGAPGVRYVDRTTRLPGNQLQAVSGYLERYYRRLGFSPRRQACTYQGRRYDNVIVDIPGRTDEWVLLADHYDAAVAGETFERHKQGLGRILPAPGADDNLSATATLMEAGRLLAPLALGGQARALGIPWPLARGLRLVHLVGEEFPADCLGARVYVHDALARREKIAGLVLMDMIGWAGAGGRMEDPVFQLNLGEHPASLKLCGAALQAFAALRAKNLVPRALAPVLRRRFDRESYLYNTDGVIFSDAGYPVLFLDEHINKQFGIDRPGYHDRTDGVGNLCRAYATGIARVALATALVAAAGP